MSVCRLTPETEKAILDAIEAGNYKQVACEHAGIHRNTLGLWEKRAENGEEPFASFVEKLRTAEAKAQMELLAEIRNARQPDTGDPIWTSRAWIMERRWPKLYAQRVRLAVAEERESLISQLQRKLDEDTFRRVVEATREDAPDADAGAAKH
jgi:hypothetical protein